MIDKEEVRKIAHLARLAITPEEETQFSGQLNSILQYFEQLSELDTENVPPTMRAIDVSNITRPDSKIIYEDRSALLDQSPDREGDFFRVPKILAGDEAV
ncbi:MAG: Glutamyl-tRNA(Gln) amidotransferase subunit C [Chroococcopsis gigantea SAG 12.99]|jgi:aspartyl-tRNA(Asn)/glutamyl-tRNA(Gln) amidotransferase subunit C|nr:Asp-tRNA(Asn)/Glu-tRNA(Gln) amidotransferase subunit GatC [Chlorogloea purpurea SAG 13.99]MDV3000553.1 Glutamyl-tRNA(Gln) amidotransferase subunit C [Chroococcopsis gigantea SAG 12.99]